MNDVTQATGSRHTRAWLQAALGAVLAIGAYQIYEFTVPAAPPIRYESGSVIASAELDYVLDDPSKGGGASGITASELLANRYGDKCRRFAQGYMSGTACFRDGKWRLLDLKQAPLPRTD